MRKHFVLFASILVPIVLFSTDSLYYETNLPETIELSYDNLEQQYWLPFDDIYMLFKSRYNHKAEIRSYWKPSAQTLTNRLLLSPETNKREKNPQFHGVFYQQLDKDKPPENITQVGIFTHNQNLLKTITFGNFRLQAGTGLFLGALNKSAAQRSRYIYPAYSMSQPAMTGMAAELQLDRFDVVGWLSQTSRYATLSESKIDKLYTSRLIITSNKDKVTEQTGGVISAFNHKSYSFGSYFYQQSFNRSFTDDKSPRQSEIFGLYSNWKILPFNLEAEAGTAEGKTATAIYARYRSKNISQSLHYIDRPYFYPLSYAKTEQVFVSYTGRREISWDTTLKPDKDWRVILRVAGVKELTPAADSQWKERLIFSMQRKIGNSQVGLNYYRFRKDAMPFYDTLNTEILPVQNRLKAFWTKQLSNSIRWQTVCQYQHFMDRKVTRNGFSMLQSAHYTSGKTKLGLSYLVWVNQKTLYQPSDLFTDEELLIQQDSDAAFRLNFYRLVSRWLSMDLRIYRPVRRVSRQTYYLGLISHL